MEAEAPVEDENKKRKGYRKVMSYDDVLDELGEFGNFQALSIAILWITAGAPGIHVLMHALTAFEPTNGFRCKIPGCDGDDWSYTDNQQLLTTDDCKYYAPSFNSTSQTCYRDLSSDVMVSCPSDAQFKYHSFEFTETIVTRFNLVCSQNFKVSLVGIMYMVGLTFGSTFAGFISDAYGRRMALLFCITVSSVGSLAGTFMPEFYSYTAFRLITGLGAVGLFNESFTLTVELCGSKKIVPCIPWVTIKGFHGNAIQIPYAIGGALLGLAAYFIRDYVMLQLVLSVIMFIQYPLWFFIPESPRWLISKDRQQQAKQLIYKMAKFDKKKIDLEDVELLPSGETSSENIVELGFKDLFRTSEVRTITIVMLIVNPIISLGYYGLGLSMTQLGGDIFVSFIVGAAVEIPGYMLCMLVIDVWGRKPFFVWCLFLTGVSCIVCGFMPDGILRTSLAMAGKLFAAGNFSVVYMYTAEIYPTTIRNTAIGACSFAGRVGAVMAPPLALYLPNIQKSLPMLIMGGASVIGAGLALVLPETVGAKLPEQIDDIRSMKENSKSFWACVSPTQKEKEEEEEERQ